MLFCCRSNAKVTAKYAVDAQVLPSRSAVEAAVMERVAVSNRKKLAALDLRVAGEVWIDVDSLSDFHIQNTTNSSGLAGGCGAPRESSLIANSFNDTGHVQAKSLAL